MNTSVRKITDGAMMAALVGLFLLLNRQLGGMLDVYATWLVPLPLVLSAVPYGGKSALLPYAAIIFLSLVIGGPQTGFYIFSAGVCGVVYGHGVRQGWNNLRLLLTTMVFTIFSNCVTTVLFASFFGYDIAMEISQFSQLISGPDAMIQVQMPQGLTAERFLTTIFVLAAVLSGVLEGVIVHLLSHLLLKRMKIQVAPPKPLSQFAAPKWLGYVCFLLFIGMNFAFRMDLPAQVQQGFLIGGVIGALILVVFGYVCCLVYGAARYRRNLALTLMLITLLLFPIMLPLLAIVGFLYITTDMREKILRR